MSQHQTDSVHRAEQTPTTQPADEAVAALTDEELEQVAGGIRGISILCNSCSTPKKYCEAPCSNPNCPSNHK